MYVHILHRNDGYSAFLSYLLKTKENKCIFHIFIAEPLPMVVNNQFGEVSNWSPMVLKPVAESEQNYS